MKRNLLEITKYLSEFLETEKSLSYWYKEGTLNTLFTNYRKVITFAPHITGLFEKGIWIPPVLKSGHEYLNPDNSRDFINQFIICQTPSGFDKNTNELQTAVSELVKEGIGIDLRIIKGVPHDTCLENKRKCHILFDNIRQGWWGQAGYEALEQGLVVLARIDKGTEDYFIKEYGFCPIINIQNMDDFKKEIRNLYNNRSLLKFLCERNASFMRNQYNIKINVNKWIDFLKSEMATQ